MSNAPRDDNRVTTILGVDSATYTTPTTIAVDPTTHRVLTQNSVSGESTKTKKYYTNAGAVTDGIIWSPASGKRWYVTSIVLNVSAACVVTLEDDLVAGDSPVLKLDIAANSGIAHHFGSFPLFSGEDAADLLITTTAGNVYVTVTGYEA